MQPNIELMDQVMTHIRLHPEQHDQESFGRQTECGTAHCFGGWAVALVDGPKAFVWSQDGWLTGVMVDGCRQDVAFRANALLGIDGWDELDHLFNNSSTVNYGCDCGNCDNAETVTDNPALYDEHNTVDDLQERVEYYRSLVIID